MFFTPVITAAFIIYTSLLNITLTSDFIKPELFGLTAADRDRIAGIAEEIKDSALAFFGRKKLPESENRPVAPLPRPNVAGIKVAARSAVAVDCRSGDVIFEQAANERWPIASLTKLMTALVFLDYNPGWDEIYEIKKEDRREGGKIYLFTGEKVKIRDIFYASITASANTETIALVRSTGMTEDEFVVKMNERAALLGMADTVFADATGLKPNYSTAAEIAKFAQIALDNEDIKKATLTSEYRFKTGDGRQKIIPSTDQLLKKPIGDGITIIGGKTGFTDEAGYCFAGRFKKGENDLVTVVLGSPTIEARFTETDNLSKWIFSNFNWPDSVVNAGEK